MLKVHELTKAYGKKMAVRGVSFAVEAGETVGLLGPNGAGKTSIMNIIAGYLPQTSGSVFVGGVSMEENPRLARARVGYMPERPPLYPDMTVSEYLQFVSRIKKVPGDHGEHLDEICERTWIQDVRKRLIRNLSKGYRQRVGMAQALVGNPPILIFDEPMAGLDPSQIHHALALLNELKGTRTIILSSHILSEIQAVCKRVIVIDRGVLMADDTTENIGARMEHVISLEVLAQGEADEIEALLLGVEGVLSVSAMADADAVAHRFVLTASKHADFRPAIARTLVQKNIPVYELKKKETSLEDIFIRLVQKENGS